MSTEKQLLYLSRADVIAAGLTMSEIIGVVEQGFREKGLGRIEMPPKPGIHPGGGDNFIHAMPAYIPALGSAGVKWVSGYPDNYKHNLPYINGLLILNDPETGLPIAIMDCVWITAMRTGAATAVAARYLANPEPKRIGILGCGVQGRTNLEALSVFYRCIQRVRAYDIRPEAADSYAKDMSQKLDLDVIAVKTPQEAVSGCDIVVTAGPIQRHPHRTIQADWLGEAAFASLVDYDSYWQPAALHQASKFCTDDIPQILHYQEMGYFQNIPAIYAELGDVVAGKKPGREYFSERIICANLGIAVDDMVVAPLVYRQAKAKGLGVWLEL